MQKELTISIDEQIYEKLLLMRLSARINIEFQRSLAESVNFS